MRTLKLKNKTHQNVGESKVSINVKTYFDRRPKAKVFQKSMMYEMT